MIYSSERILKPCPRSPWRPAIVYYRAVAAGYHLGDRANTGHYWALVRGTEPGGAAGFRRCNDAVTSGPDLARGMRWDDADAQRRVALVALERVDGAGVRASRSERLNALSPPQGAPVGLPCAACTLLNPVTARACAACRAPLRTR